MAAARNIPPMDDPAPYPVSISSTGVVSPATGIMMNNQSVQFTNNTGAQITVTFQADGQGETVFPNTPVPGNGGTATVSPQTSDRTANFNIDGSNSFPYAIQVGAGPLYVLVSWDTSLAEADCNPSPAVIPAGGTVKMFRESTDSHTYSVRWPNIVSNPFTPPLTSADGLVHTANTTGNLGYTLNSPAPGDQIGHGAGTIKVGN
jgi:hypothetical protein